MPNVGVFDIPKHISMAKKCFFGVPIKSTNGLSTFNPHYQPHYPFAATSSKSKGNYFSIILQSQTIIVLLGPKLIEIMKHKLTNSARIIQFGSQSKMFRKNFTTKAAEKLLKATQCYLYTTAGEISGFLFVSTERVAFCSIKSIEIYSTTGKLLKFHYKVSIPVGKIKGVHESVNMKRPSNNYVELVTVDDFSFWLTGFKSCKSMLGHLHNAIGLDYLSC
ncbi:GEM-like protein 7 [Rutidosis leptorrhynchoides]|uniref:GEM-like protein 7 n=1 Tax=Rutidosis leptorrhynchoides TaxID=125765 RepID=UPI003A993EA1